MTVRELWQVKNRDLWRMSQSWQYLFHFLVLPLFLYYRWNHVSLWSLTGSWLLFPMPTVSGRKKSWLSRRKRCAHNLILLLIRCSSAFQEEFPSVCYPAKTPFTSPCLLRTQCPSVVLEKTKQRAEKISFCWTQVWCVLRNPVKMHLRAEMLLQRWFHGRGLTPLCLASGLGS